MTTMQVHVPAEVTTIVLVRERNRAVARALPNTVESSRPAPPTPVPLSDAAEQTWACFWVWGERRGQVALDDFREACKALRTRERRQLIDRCLKQFDDLIYQAAGAVAGDMGYSDPFQALRDDPEEDYAEGENNPGGDA